MAQHRIWLTAITLLLPAVLSVVLLRFWPAALAFHDSLLAPRATSYSLDNYFYIFNDPIFQNSVRVTLLYSLIVNPLQIIAALLLAMLMNNHLPMTGLWRTLILLPVAIPPSVSAVVWGVIYRPDGLMNGLLAVFGIEPQRYFTSPDQALPSLILLVSWIGVGYWMTFLIAGLQDIPKSLYEAARIDGLNGWQQFTYITLPQLRRSLTFVLVANTVANFLVFAPVQILTEGGPQGSTNLIMNEIYTRAFGIGDRSSAAAAVVVLVLLVLLIVGVQFQLMKDVQEK